MKVEVKETQSQEVDWSKNPQLVVLNNTVVMTASNQSKCMSTDFAGVVIKSDEAWTVGFYSKCFTKDLWKPFHGEITLKND